MGVSSICPTIVISSRLPFTPRGNPVEDSIQAMLMIHTSESQQHLHRLVDIGSHAL